MERTIYLDILFCVNFVIDYVILLTVRKFLSISCRRRRMLFGAAVGGVSSAVILLPPLPSLISAFFSMAVAAAVVGAAFAPMKLPLFLKTAAAFFLISFLYCGAMIAVWMLFTPDRLLIRNSTVYISIPPGVLVLTTLGCYLILRLLLRITGRGESPSARCTVRIRIGDESSDFNGMVDTGCRLHEPFSGDPVIVLSSGAAKRIGKLSSLCGGLGDEHPGNVRLVPYDSVGGSGLLKALRPERTELLFCGRVICAEAYIAVCPEERLRKGEEAIVPAELLQ